MSERDPQVYEVIREDGQRLRAANHRIWREIQDAVVIQCIRVAPCGIARERVLGNLEAETTNFASSLEPFKQQPPRWATDDKPIYLALWPQWGVPPFQRSRLTVEDPGGVWYTDLQISPSFEVGDWQIDWSEVLRHLVNYGLVEGPEVTLQRNVTDRT